MFFDIATHGETLDHVSFKDFADKVPKTAENIHALSTGEKEFGYKGSHFHRNVLGLMCQGGDFTHHNGTGGKSIYGKKFDENFYPEAHTSTGILSMTNAGPDTYGSQVFICSVKTQWLDGMDVMTVMECSGSMNGKTSKITITDCGQLS